MSEIDKKTLQNLRIEYSSSPINESAVDANPISFFGKWFDEAMAAEVREPNAMTLATATRDGIPSARIVLLKGADKNGTCQKPIGLFGIFLARIRKTSKN